MYQTVKFFLVRLGWSILLLVTMGYFALYFIHEVVLPRSQFDDSAIQFVLLVLCLFFGFFAYGLLGEQHFLNALHGLKDNDPDRSPDEIIPQFEYLLDFSYSSFFLPTQGRRFREEVVWRFANYLLFIGREDPRALKVYLKAFLQKPRNSKFRAPLLSILARGGDLTEQEVDLLLVMLKAEEYRDDVITDHLASVFLRGRKFTRKTEPVFLAALENKSKNSEQIVQFVFPQLIAKNRADDYALRFYFSALPFNPSGDQRAREILARAWCQGHWQGLDPELHQKCGQVWTELGPAEQERIRKEVDESRISGKLKHVKLFTSEDARELERLKIQMGIVQTGGEWIKGAGRWLASILVAGIRNIVLLLIDCLIGFGKLNLKIKLIAVLAVSMILIAGISLKVWVTQDQKVPVERTATEEAKIKRQVAKKPRLHTIQVAAVTSSGQADSLIRQLQKQGLKGLYIVKSPRSAGGNWYKIRVGQFDSQEEARRFADALIDKKIVKNYFILSLPKAHKAIQ